MLSILILVIKISVIPGACLHVRLRPILPQARLLLLLPAAFLRGQLPSGLPPALCGGGMSWPTLAPEPPGPPLWIEFQLLTAAICSRALRLPSSPVFFLTPLLCFLGSPPSKLPAIESLSQGQPLWDPNQDTYTRVHIYYQRCAHVCTCLHLCTYMQAQACSHVHTCTHAHTRGHMHKYWCTHSVRALSRGEEDVVTEESSQACPLCGHHTTSLAGSRNGQWAVHTPAQALLG